MTGRKFTDKEKKFRARLRSGVCKARLARWFVGAGLNDSEKDVLYRVFLQGQSREQIAMDTYACKTTVSRKVSQGIAKLMDYFEYSNVEDSPF